MSWHTITRDEWKWVNAVIKWIETVRDTPKTGYPSDWLPGTHDAPKSALLERLRNGKAPLEYPPPLGMSCPWYAVVEDPGPHYVFDFRVDKFPQYTLPGEEPRDRAFIYQSLYEIEESRDNEYIVRDGRHDTPYRFRVWYDKDWKHPNGRIEGGWFMQNVAFKDQGSISDERP